MLAAVIGGVNLLFLEILTRSLEPDVQRTGEEHYLELLKDNYPLVRSIRRFSEMDYSHALRVSEISGECAGKLGLKENLCRAAGFLLSYRTYGGRALYGEWGVACTECLFSGRTDTDLKRIQWRTDGDFHEGIGNRTYGR